MLETVTMTSPHFFEETTDALKTAFMSMGFGTLCSISLNERFEAKGLHYDDKITILEVCNPFEALSALTIDPDIAYFLPCKVLIKEVKGEVSVTMIKPTSFITLLDHDHLNEFAIKIEKALLQAIESLSN